jgi:hypothetical protein
MAKSTSSRDHSTTSRSFDSELPTWKSANPAAGMIRKGMEMRRASDTSAGGFLANTFSKAFGTSSNDSEKSLKVTTEKKQSMGSEDGNPSVLDMLIALKQLVHDPEHVSGQEAYRDPTRQDYTATQKV